MTLIHSVALSVLLLTIKTLVGAGTVTQSLEDFISQPLDYNAQLCGTMRLVKRERERVRELLQEVDGQVTLLFPTDNAWALRPGALQALLSEESQQLRYDLLLAGAVTDIPAGKTWEEARALSQDVVNSAFGTTYLLGDEQIVCIAAWDGSRYIPDAPEHCAQVHVGDAIYLTDAVVYPISRVILPYELEEDLRRARLATAASPSFRGPAPIGGDSSGAVPSAGKYEPDYAQPRH